MTETQASALPRAVRSVIEGSIEDGHRSSLETVGPTHVCAFQAFLQSRPRPPLPSLPDPRPPEPSTRFMPPKTPPRSSGRRLLCLFSKIFQRQR
jgi:hypothetical protein